MKIEEFAKKVRDLVASLRNIPIFAFGLWNERMLPFKFHFPWVTEDCAIERRMAATIPGEMVQYYWHTFVLAHKLAYLYGIPDLRDEEGNLSETSQDMLTLFVGVMMGAAAANNVIKAFAEQVVKRLPRQALTKTVYYPIIKQVAKWIGINLTKSSFAKGLGKAISILGGAISGTLTFASFRPSAKRLQKKLREQMYDIKVDSNPTDDSKVEDAEYEDVTE